MKHLLLSLVALSSLSAFAEGMLVTGSGANEVAAIQNAQVQCAGAAYKAYGNYNRNAVDIYKLSENKKTTQYDAVGLCTYTNTDD